MKKKFIRQLVKFSILFLLAFALYRLGYPNDFFLSHRAFKNEQMYLYERDPSHLKIISKNHVNPDLHHLLSNLDTYLEDPRGWIKNNHKRTISRVEIEGSVFFVKRYNYRNFFDYITKCPFRSSKAFRSFFYALKFKEKGILTPQPLALVEKRVLGLWTSCYLVFPFMEGDTLESYLENTADVPPANWQGQVKRYLKAFYENTWLHRDLTPRNLFLSNSELYVLDLDDIHSYAFNGRVYKRKFTKKHIEKFLSEFKETPSEFETAFFDYI